MAPYEQQHDEIPVAGSGVAVAPPSLQGRGFKHMLIDLDDTLYQNPEVSAQVLAAIKSGL